jgi:hypothetical protein
LDNSFVKKVAALVLPLLLIAVASITYYFTIALPKYNKARLDFEVQKYRDQKAQEERERSDRELKEQLKQIHDETKEKLKRINEEALDECLREADAARIRYVERNGGVRKEDGWIEAPRYVWEDADRKMKIGKDDCYKRYR